MTAALRCDGPDCDEWASDPERAVRWWRLERNGRDIPEPRIPGELPTFPLIPAELILTEHVGDDFEPPELTEDDMDQPVLHFHAARCLLGWAETAAALEG